jgi:pimeloyl-ACP methyl ester carboxylesterase
MAAASGEVGEVRLAQGVIRYREMGTGEPIVFVHGVLVNGGLWRDVASPLAEAGYRCIMPDLPLGGHSYAMDRDADLSPPGLARLVADLVEELDLRDVTLVGNDTGGGISQIVISEHPERMGCLVLTNCDAYEHFPPPLIAPFKWGAFVPGFVSGLAYLLRISPAFGRLLYALLAHRTPEKEVLASFFGPLVRDAGVRRDLRKVLAGVSNRYTLEAAKSFAGFHKPVLIVWGKDDFVFFRRDAQKLAIDFPDARLEWAEHSRAFVPEDRPDLLAALMRDFLAQRVGTERR